MVVGVVWGGDAGVSDLFLNMNPKLKYFFWRGGGNLGGGGGGLE